MRKNSPINDVIIFILMTVIVEGPSKEQKWISVPNPSHLGWR